MTSRKLSVYSTHVLRIVLSLTIFENICALSVRHPPRGAQSWRRGPTLSSSSSLRAVKESTFGMGCFWEPSEELLKVDGVIDTIAGYTGNPNAKTSKAPPSYESVCYGNNWVEGVRVTFDDDVISYERLLEEFFAIQKPKLGYRQYASIIFPHDGEQMEAAAKWIAENAGRERDDGFRAEWTEIEPLTVFYQAEGYHQRYWQKQRPRFAAMICLLAVATGLLEPTIPLALQKTVESAANAAAITIGLYIAAERFLDSKVVEL